MKYHLISTKDPTLLVKSMNEFKVQELGSSWTLNGSFYQSFIGEPKVTKDKPKVTKDKPKVTKDKPKVTKDKPKVTKKTKVTKADKT